MFRDVNDLADFHGAGITPVTKDVLTSEVITSKRELAHNLGRVEVDCLDQLRAQIWMIEDACILPVKKKVQLLG